MFIQNRGLGYIYTFNLPALKDLVNRLMEHTLSYQSYLKNLSDSSFMELDCFQERKQRKYPNR